MENKIETKQKAIKNEVSKSKLESTCDFIWIISLVITSISAIGFSIYLSVIYFKNKVYFQNIDKYVDLDGDIVTRNFIEINYDLVIFFIVLLFVAMVGLLFIKKINNNIIKLIVLSLIIVGVIILSVLSYHFSTGLQAFTKYFPDHIQLNILI